MIFKEKVNISDLKTGDKIQFGQINGEPIVWFVSEKDHKDYPSDSVTIVTENTIGNLTFSSANPVDKNHDRRLYGSNRYADSYAGKYLNSDEFLATVFTEEEAQAILQTPVKVKIPEIDGSGVDTITAFLFLLSASEVGHEEEDEEGNIIELFKDSKKRMALDIKGDRDWYWLRSAIVSNSYSVRHVDADGAAGNNHAYGGTGGVRPACNLKSDYLVSRIGGKE